MNIYSVFSLIAAIVCFSLGFFVYFKSRGDFVKKIFSVGTIFIGIWSSFPFLMSIAKDGYQALLFARILYLAASYVPSMFLHFMLVFVGKKLTRRRKTIVLVSYIISSLFLIISFSPIFIREIRRFAPHFALVPGYMYLYFTLSFIAMGVYSFLNFFRAFLDSTGYRRNQLKYVYIAIFCAFSGGIVHFIAAYFNWEPFPHDLLVIVYPCLMTYAIIKHRLMDIKVAVTRAGIFLVVYAFVLGLPFWFGFSTGFLAWSLILMAILATAGPFIYRRLQQKAEAILLAQQKHYQRLLLQAATGMVREHNLKKLLGLIVHVVKNAVKIEFSAIFLKDKEDNKYTLKALRDHKSFPEALTFSYEHSIIKLIKERRTPLSYEEISHLSEGGLYKPIHLIVPCFIDENLLGFLALGEKKDRTFYTQDDINVFEILSRQTALAVEYCMFLEEFRKGQEKIFTAEKLASIGGMAGGMAHQIRNRLGVFRACAETLEFTVEEYITKHSKVMEEDIELKNILEDVIKGFNTIVSNVERTAKLVNGIIDFARTQETDIGFSEFILMEIIDLCIPILKAKHSLGEELPFSLKIEVGSKDTIYGSKGQLAEGMFNFLDNGYEALLEIGLYLSEEEKKDYRPEIKIRLTQTKDSYLIEVSDNGIGIKEEDKLRIFSPYFTTKASSISGTGIGMYVIKRIIEENHKGRIHFESTYKKGTKFYIELPKKGSRKE